MIIRCYCSHCYWYLPPLSALIMRLPARSSFTVPATAGAGMMTGCSRLLKPVVYAVVGATAATKVDATGAELRCPVFAATNAAIGTTC